MVSSSKIDDIELRLATGPPDDDDQPRWSEWDSIAKHSNIPITSRVEAHSPGSPTMCTIAKTGHMAQETRKYGAVLCNSDPPSRSATENGGHLFIHSEDDTARELQAISAGRHVLSFKLLTTSLTSLGVVPVQNLNAPSSVNIL